MSILRESYLYHLWAVLCTVYYDSAVHRCLVRMGAWCNRQIDESRVLRVLCREGVAARAWEESILCRLLTGLINLPAWLLHKLYLALRATFDDSVFSRLAFEMGHETAIAQSWLIMLLWVIPFSHWNNAYSMLGFAALLVLFYAGAMSRRDFRLDVRHIGFYPVVLFGAMFLAVLFSYEPSASFRFLLYHISAAMCVLVTVSAVRGTEDLKRLAAGGGVCVLVSSLYGVYQRIQGVEVNESYVDLEVNAGMPGRVESYFDNPNTFAEVLILLLPRNREETVGIIVTGMVLCEIFSAVTLTALFRRWWRSAPKSPPREHVGWGQLLSISIPVAATSLLGTILGSANAVLIPAKLVAGGADPSAAISAFGVLCGMTMPLLNLPTGFIGALCLVLVPNLAQKHALGDGRAVHGFLDRVLSATSLLMAPAMALLTVVGPDLARWVFGDAAAGDYMLPLAVGTLLGCYQSLSTA